MNRNDTDEHLTIQAEIYSMVQRMEVDVATLREEVGFLVAMFRCSHCEGEGGIMIQKDDELEWKECEKCKGLGYVK